MADQLGVISKRTGVAVEDLSVLKFAAEQSETSFDTLTVGLQKFEIRLAKAGISGNQTIAMLLGLADHFQKTEDPAKRLEIAVANFGRSAGPELVPFLAQGSAGINELIQKLRDMGGVITGETAAAADEFNDQLAALSSQASALAANLAGPVLKSITAFIAALGRASDISDAVEGTEQFRESAKGITDEIQAIDEALAGGQPAKEGIIARRAELEGLKAELIKTRREALGIDPRRPRPRPPSRLRRGGRKDPRRSSQTAQATQGEGRRRQRGCQRCQGPHRCHPGRHTGRPGATAAGPRPGP